MPASIFGASNPTSLRLASISAISFFVVSSASTTFFGAIFAAALAAFARSMAAAIAACFAAFLMASSSTIGRASPEAAWLLACRAPFSALVLFVSVASAFSAANLAAATLPASARSACFCARSSFSRSIRASLKSLRSRAKSAASLALSTAIISLLA